MGKYRRVTLAVRCQIDAFLQAGWNIPEISKKLGYHKSTIYREIERNFSGNTYTPVLADERARRRYQRCRRPYKAQGEALDFIARALAFGMSPEQISGRLWVEQSIRISHQCVYEAVYRYPELRQFLRRPKGKRGGGRYLQRRCLSRGRKSIHERPKRANERTRRGDWERDGMYGANRNQLLVMTDRRTRFTKIAKIGKGSSSRVNEETLRLIEQTGTRAYSITNDNGSEFRGKPLDIPTYYCDPMKPQQRGTVENTIGLLRQWIKRTTDLDKLGKQELQLLENRLNHRPRKCLNYRTPFEVFYNRRVALAF